MLHGMGIFTKPFPVCSCGHFSLFFPSFLTNPIGSMGLVYLPTFTIKINHACKVNIPFVPWIRHGNNSYQKDPAHLGIGLALQHRIEATHDFLSEGFLGQCKSH